MIARSLALACALAACAPPAEPPLSALLVTFDTTRADAVTPLGAAPGVTPSLARLARAGVVFERAYTVAPITLPAHASLFTGLYPPRHRVRDNGVHVLPEAARTLAEAAREAGLQTAGFVSAAVLDRGFGIDQGFDVYDAPARPRDQHGRAIAERSAAETAARAVAWLGRRDCSRGFLLWVHLFDPHAPYSPGERLRARAGGAYPGEVAAADEGFGRVYDALAAHGLERSTLVVALADHGEGLGEHGEATHSLYVWESTLHVPLIVRWPDGRDSGERRDDVVGVVDVFPTVCEVLGLSSAGDLDGASLAQPGERGHYFESYAGWLSFGWSPLAGWIDARGKYVHSSRPALFDPSGDPLEQRDLAGERADELERYRAAIAAALARPALAAARETPDADLRERVRDLGYAAAADAGASVPHPLARSDRPSPLDRIDEYAQVERAQHAMARADFLEAERILRAVVAAHPDNAYALERLALSLIRQDRCAEALGALETIVAQGRGSADTHTYLGACLFATRAPERAVRAFERALSLDPNHAQALLGLAHVLDALGRGAQADVVHARLRAAESR